MDIQDKRIQCVDCGREFVFTVGEQEFFRQRGLVNQPKRCKQCKAKQVEVFQPGMIRTSNRVETPVVCSLCGKETTVPFVPKQRRPVLCRDCFQARQGTA
jgi:CxxC-x17-CxxC domain-containing protein